MSTVESGGGGDNDPSMSAIVPYLQMETKLSSAPLSLAVMANLNLIAAQADDFSLLLGASGKNLERNELIKNPTSFRGTVVQVSNEMYTAFLSADSAMTSIKLCMSPNQLPACIKDILELIDEGTGREICEELPGDIERVNKILKSCIETTDDVVNKFDALMALLSEVIRLTVTAQGASKNDINNFKNLQQSEKKNQDFLLARLNEVQEELKTLESRKDAEYRAYKDKLERMGDVSFADVAKIAIVGIIDALNSKEDGGAKGGAKNQTGSSLEPESLNGPNQSDGRLADKILERSRNQMQMSRQDYLDAKEDMEAMKKQQLEYNKSMLETIKKMEEYKNNEATAANTLEVATTALEALGKAKEHWHDMLSYFRGAKDIMDIALAKPLRQFISDTNLAKSRLTDDGRNALSDRFKRKLHRSVDSANQVIKLLFHFSNNYHQISGEYLMPMVASYGSMIAMNKEEDIKKLRKEINEKAGGIQQVIEAMIRSNHSKFGVEYVDPKEPQNKRKNSSKDCSGPAKKPKS